MEETSIKIKQFLAPSFGDYDLQDDDNIFSLGFVNSMFAMQLVLFLEQEFKIQLDNEDLDFENFKSIKAMTELVDQKKVAVVGS